MHDIKSKKDLAPHLLFSIIDSKKSYIALRAQMPRHRRVSGHAKGNRHMEAATVD
jgi:hypothetical protein